MAVVPFLCHENKDVEALPMLTTRCMLFGQPGASPGFSSNKAETCSLLLSFFKVYALWAVW